MKEFSERLMVVADELAGYDLSDEVFYRNWLAQSYYFVRHSTPLLALSAGLSVDNPAYHQRCIAHLPEERGHDRLILADLQAMEAKIEDFPELYATQALYQTQYFWIQHRSPTALLGYIVFLEGISVHSGPRALEQASRWNATSFLKVHVAADPKHIDKAFELIGSLAPEQQALARRNFDLSSYLYSAMLKEIKNGMRPGAR